MSKKIVIKANREKSLKRLHPWIFSGAVAKIDGKLHPGEAVQVVSSQGEFLAVASYSPSSQIIGRVWSFCEEPINEEFFIEKLKTALEYRKSLGLFAENLACRLVASEADFLPGLIVDYYAKFLVVQFLSAGAEFYRDVIISALQKVVLHSGIYERSDVGVRAKEGLDSRVGVLSGDAPPKPIKIVENDFEYCVDVYDGHKTGFYLDQRDNRLALARIAQAKSVLNCFSYTGGFGVAAAKSGAAHVTNIDVSQAALDLAAKNFELNGIASEKYENCCADVFKQLRAYRDAGRRFDVIVLDPPKFIENKRQVMQACRGYKDIAILGFKLLNPGGTLLTFSCSGLMPVDLFQKVTADAALDAKRNAKIVKHLEQAPDHPTLLSFPESFYLKGLVLNVD